MAYSSCACVPRVNKEEARGGRTDDRISLQVPSTSKHSIGISQLEQKSNVVIKENL